MLLRRLMGLNLFMPTLLIPLFRLKGLIPVNFTRQSRSSNSTSADDGASKLKDEELDPMCPSCKKALSNSVRIYSTSLTSTETPLLHLLGPVSHERMFACDM